MSLHKCYNFSMKPALRGFTLIELLIVISLVTIITGAVIPSFNSYIDNQGVKQAQETIKDDLRTVQNKALNGEKATVELGTPAETVEYWGIEFSQDSTTYTTFISTDQSTCNGGATRQDEVTSRPLPGGNVVRSPDDCVWFSFANGDATSSNGTITVGPLVGGNDVCRRVVAASSGLIYAEGIDEDACIP